ncbi:unnamed protein product [Medioppia subpectinata]|uniref:Uncharacterized protein n=1 Tax=Medioppia subpectinata TaxID=1979941 RepID=A0A7R9L3D9_9ACAR|nr:unnamed protein product [Medioppia subpectinata]CAG2114560.1 unnamed protein product [Medioppia subpectinata]
MEVKLFESLSKHLNFTYRIINCNSDWGVFISKNKTWTGLIGQIVAKQADIAFSGLTVTAQRSEYVYFTHPHIITSVSFITPPPKSLPKITLVIEPFEGLVWVCIVMSIILMVFTEYLITKKWTHLKKVDIKWAIISALLKQCLAFRLPNIFSLRIMICFWLLACLVLTASYSGCLYSLMAIPSRAKPINTINELADAQRRGEIQVTAIGGSSYFDSLKNAKFGVYKEIGELIKPVADKEKGLDIVRIATKPHAYVSTRDHLYYGLLKFGPKVFHLPPPTQESTVFLDVMAIAMQCEFPHKQIFNKLISDLKKGGFLDYWRLTENRKLAVNGDQKVNDIDDKREHEILVVDQLQSAFYLMAMSYCLAFIGLLVEIIFQKKITISVDVVDRYYY